MHSYSVKLYGNLQRVQAESLVSLYLQVLLNGEKYMLNIDLKWPKKFVDNKAGAILPRSKPDKDYHDYLMTINDRIAKVNDIFKIYRIQDRVLTVEGFKQEYKSFDMRKDFLVFMEAEIEERYVKGEIKQRTHLNHRSALHKLQLFKNPVYFYDLTARFFTNFKAYLRNKHKNGETTVWANVKEIRTYIGRARAANIFVEEDYKKDKNHVNSGRIVYLEDNELKKMYLLFLSEDITDILRESLRAFLFQCFTSLRISDVYKANWNWVNKNNEMVF